MRNDDTKMLIQWHQLAPRVWEYFALSLTERRAACVAARRSPRGALRAYRAIAASIKPHYPSGA